MWEGSSIDGVSILERDDVLERLRQSLAEVDDGRGGSLFMVAEAGVGKTSVLQAATALAPAGWDVASARGQVMETSLAFGVMAQLARSLADEGLVDPGPMRQALDAGAPYHRVLRWMETRGDRRLLLVVDDLHWADPDSLRVLGFMARRLARHPVGLISALRPWPRAAEDLCRQLEAAGLATVVRLEPLSKAASAQLLGLRSGVDLGAGTEAKAWDLCQGNPLLIEQVALRLAKHPEARALVGDGRGGRAATRLLLLRFAGLDEDTFDFVRCAAVLGARFRPEVAAAMCGLEDPEVDRALAALSHSGLVIEAGLGALSFAHPLFAQAVYEELSAPERERLHRRAFTVLADLGLDAEAAEHAARDAFVGDERALATLERAGTGALASGAVDAAARHLEAAVRLSVGEPPTARQYLLCAALTASGRIEEASAVCRRLLAREDLGELESVDVLQMLGRTQLATASDHGEASHAEAVRLALRVDPSRAVTALLDQALSAWMAAGPGRALPLVEQARRLAGQHAGREEQERAEVAWGSLAYETGDPSGLAAALGARRFVDDPSGSASLDRWEITWPWARLYKYAVTAIYAEHHDDAARALTVGREIAERAGATNALSMLAMFRTNLALRTGDLPCAHEEARGAMEFGDLTGGVTAYGLLGQAEVLLWLGDLDACEAACAEAAALAPDDWFASAWRAHVLGQMHLWKGDAAAASDQYARAEAITVRAGIGEPCHLQWQARAAEAHARAGRLDAAARVVAWTEAAAALLPCRWPSIAATVGKAHLTLARGDLEGAREHLDAAVALHATVHLPLLLAELRLARGRLLLRAGRLRPGRAELGASLVDLRARGADGLARVVEADLRRSGVRRMPTESTARLSPAQRRVARLAARGHTNAEIAAALNVSVNTVETHLRRAFDKLGVRSRRELRPEAVDAERP